MSLVYEEQADMSAGNILFHQFVFQISCVPVGEL